MPPALDPAIRSVRRRPASADFLRRCVLAHVNLAGHGGEDQRGAAFLQQVDGVVGLRR